MITYGLLAAAAALFLWPQKQQLASPTPFDIAVAKKSHPNYQSSIMALTQVRQRLIATDSLADQQKQAIDTLTLSLVAGSDRE